MIDITVVILTFNEHIHIRRAIESIKPIAKRIVIIDSFSTDETINISKELGAEVFQNKFINHAIQFEWGLKNAEINTGWVMRLDADEYITPELAQEIQSKVPNLNTDISGIILKRQVHFMGQWIRYGGYYPVKLLRIWRTGHAAIEQQWMDEHIWLKQGKEITFENDFIDDNLNSLTWWTNKHNDYATREAIDILNREHHFLTSTATNGSVLKNQMKQKRWYKNNLYLRLPMFFRCFLYFSYRYWIRLGFLDGRKGLIWHFLQGFWYRFLVDAKITQMRWWAAKEKVPVSKIISEKYNVRI